MAWPVASTVNIITLLLAGVPKKQELTLRMAQPFSSPPSTAHQHPSTDLILLACQLQPRPWLLQPFWGIPTREGDTFASFLQPKVSPSLFHLPGCIQPNAQHDPQALCSQLLTPPSLSP